MFFIVFLGRKSFSFRKRCLFLRHLILESRIRVPQTHSLEPPRQPPLRPLRVKIRVRIRVRVRVEVRVRGITSTTASSAS